MANNNALSKAKNSEYDEYYTRYIDIQNEINTYIEYNPNVFKNKIVLCPCDDPEWSNFTKFFAQNFVMLGLKKLICTSYSPRKKTESYGYNYQMNIFDYTDNGSFDETREFNHGKIFILDRKTAKGNNLNFDSLSWDYLEEDGDFSSAEVTRLRDEADVVVTNPPFSLFRKFMSWINEANKEFIILGNPNLLSKRDIFPLIKDNKIWVGCKSMSTDAYFIIPDYYKERLLKESKEGSGYKTIDGIVYGRTQAIWYTNIEHGRRHNFIPLMPMSDNIKYSKHKNSDKWKYAYKKFDNYDALEIPYIDSIPNDYKGIMAVPISFMDKYCPEQFEIIGRTGDIIWCNNECSFFTPCSDSDKIKFKKMNNTWRIQNAYMYFDNHLKTFYDRIFIRYTENWIEKHPQDFEGVGAI